MYVYLLSDFLSLSIEYKLRDGKLLFIFFFFCFNYSVSDA